MYVLMHRRICEQGYSTDCALRVMSRLLAPLLTVW